jgi:energy-converting hydrogenase Eha subunit H
MFAYVVMLILLVMVSMLMFLGTSAKPFLIKMNKWDFKPQPVTTANKVMKVILAIVLTTLAYFATVGQSASDFALALFVVQTTTMSIGTIRGLMQHKTKDSSMPALVASTIYSFGLLASYIYLGVAVL